MKDLPELPERCLRCHTAWEAISHDPGEEGGPFCAVCREGILKPGEMLLDPESELEKQRVSEGMRL